MLKTIKTKNSVFALDVKKGLESFPKTLPSKYFYDKRGDELFQEIMNLKEYYLTKSEHEIFQTQKQEILAQFYKNAAPFKLIELGAGDGLKTKVLLNHFVDAEVDFTYSPIDISSNVLSQLSNDLSTNIPKLNVEVVQGDYFEALGKINQKGSCREVVLFLGSNIGNFNNDEALDFLQKLSNNLSADDGLFIGFDLMKDPDVILNAYNDKRGVTRDFNKNLLTRINNELGANFNLNSFRHVPTYNPTSGETKSHLVSTIDQRIFIEDLDQEFHFNAWEAIHTEISQKYSYKMIHEFAEKSGFKLLKNFTDSQEYYVNSYWEKR
jgi:L-histidine Nalpha-methyltransferase